MDNHSGTGRAIVTLDTPALLLDEEILESNLRTMQDVLSACGKNVRPHAKTHKSSYIAEKQIEAGAVGICAAKVSEAEGLAAHGIRELLITSPVITDVKIQRLFHLVKSDCHVMVVLDNPDNIKHLSQCARRHRTVLDILIDIDPGMGRTGVSFREVPGLIRLVERCGNLRFKGIQCYAGSVQHIPNYTERKKQSRAILEKAGELVRNLDSSGHTCEIFTGGGTGTYDIDSDIPELTDLQAGSYAVMDAEYLAVGSENSPGEFLAFPPALTLLSTVISTNRAEWVTIDAGLKTLYHHGADPIPLPRRNGWEYQWFGDEHGKLTRKGEIPLPALGEQVELIISHCDPTINLFDHYSVHRNGTVTDTWDIDLRGCST